MRWPSPGPALQTAGLIDVSKSIYTGARISWLSLLFGGFLFGFGMTIASGCGSKTLIRLGGGNLRALVVLVFVALAASMTLRGVFAPWRANALDPVRLDLTGLGAATSDLPSLVTALGLARRRSSSAAARGRRDRGIRPREPRFPRVERNDHRRHRDRHRDRRRLVRDRAHRVRPGRSRHARGTIRGVQLRPVESYSFVAPTAYLLELLLLWTDQSRTLTFGIAGVLGVAVGSAIAAGDQDLSLGELLRPDDLAHHVAGGVLMGFGGVTALGCTIGQGLTGLSTLAVGSFLAFGGIIAGGVAALRYQSWRVERMG